MNPDTKGIWQSVERITIYETSPTRTIVVENTDARAVMAVYGNERGIISIRVPHDLVQGIIEPAKSYGIKFRTYNTANVGLEIGAIVTFGSVETAYGCTYVLLNRVHECTNAALLRMLSRDHAMRKGQTAYTQTLDGYAGEFISARKFIDRITGVLDHANLAMEESDLVARIESVIMLLQSTQVHEEVIMRRAWNSYQDWALTKANEEAFVNVYLTGNLNPALLNAALGLTGEAGEFADMVKKIIFHDHPLDSNMRDALIKELGDLLWYVACGTTGLEVSLYDIMQQNRDKLDHRYPHGFERTRSIRRQESVNPADGMDDHVA